MQVQHGIYIDLRRHLFGDDLVGGQLEEPLGESVQVFLFQGEAGGIRVPPKFSNRSRQLSIALYMSNPVTERAEPVISSDDFVRTTAGR